MAENKYTISEAPTWANSLSSEEIIEQVKDTAFARQQLDEERDFCYYIDRTYYTDEKELGDYLLMVYTLSQPSSLEGASIYELLVEEKETYTLNRISVLRNGQIIDKFVDCSIKVMDSDSQPGNRVLSNTKKIHINIRDLHLHDVLIIENTRHRKIQEDDFLRREFERYIWPAPDSYWAYGVYNFRFVNKRDKPIAYRKSFFRDNDGNLLAPESSVLASGEEFGFSLKDYATIIDAGREVYPFVDFVTDCDWKTLSNFIAPVYTDSIGRHRLPDFAPDIVEKLDELDSVDDKIQYAIEYVQNSIYYIYNGDEMDGHKPQEAAITLQNKQGDCKAKTVLLKTILDYIGVESSIVLVNFSNDFYMPYYLPSLFAFNHVVNKIYYQGEEHFVDPTQRDQYGYLPNRGHLYFKYYLEIKPDAELTTRGAVEYPDFAIEEKINFDVKGNTGYLKTVSKLRYNRANYMRQYFKRTNKKEIVDGWNNFLFGTLNYHNDRKDTDPRDIFKDVSLQITHDDKQANELTVEYSATIDNPYFTERDGKRFLMYYDHNVYKGSIRDYKHRDVPLWHSYDAEKYEISLYTDQRIDMEERFTKQECSIDNPYFKHSIRKKIDKNGATAYVEYRPIANVEIPFDQIETLKGDYIVLANSNFGLGIDIVEAGLFNFLKFNFKKKFG